MSGRINKSKAKQNTGARVILINKGAKWKSLGLAKEQESFIKDRLKGDDTFIQVPSLEETLIILALPDTETDADKEEHRKLGHRATSVINAEKREDVQLLDKGTSGALALAVMEGMALSNYQFLKYKSEPETNSLKTLYLDTPNCTDEAIDQLNITVEAVYIARDLVNEPLSYLDAPQISAEMEGLSKRAGFKLEVFNKAKIESLKMGGLLAVNRGSITPPTFNILEWKPKNAVNKKPIILVGKGVVYDTGGISLKPSNSMADMKSDMGGAAAVIGGIYGAAAMELPVHVIGLIPATDNRPGEEAYVPGDVIHMYNGKTVEVLNTDAEGRMILADALAYADKFKPEFVMDFATLTGAAAFAIGPYATVCMGNASEKIKKELHRAGNAVHERLVEFPFFSDYDALLASDIADMKNIGGRIGGAITAGKFLANFVNYPWMHFDIAGPAYSDKPDAYRGKNGTGNSVRFIIEYLKQRTKQK